MKSYTKIKRQLLKNKTTRQAYQKLGMEFMLAQTVIEKRLAKVLDAEIVISLS